MLTKLPKPITLIHCSDCKDIVELERTPTGNYCMDCGNRIAVNHKTFDVK